jgi:hypothetical protein
MQKHSPALAIERISLDGVRATVLGRVKRWVLAMLACEEQAARGCAPAAKRRRF